VRTTERAAGRDIALLFSTRILRLFSYGFLSVVLVLYLKEAGLPEAAIGLLFSMTLAGDALISLFISTRADRIGRRRMLVAGSCLVVLAGIVFASTGDFTLLLLAAVVGVISPSGNEVGPFLPIEQAALSQLVDGGSRTAVFAWYNLAGSFATALGALAGGGLAQVLLAGGMAPLAGYRAIVVTYALLGIALGALFTLLSPSVEAPKAETPADKPSGKQIAPFLGLRESKGILLKISALFSLDAFAGGFVVQTFIAYWFHLRFALEPAALGGIFFGANILAGLSALSAASIARRIGLVNTMVFTHLPSNVLLVLVPLMPTLPLAIAVLLLRYSISQMDVPTRQSWTMAVVEPDERAAAAGVTGMARSAGASISPSIAGILMGIPALAGLPFLLAGGLKIVYDLALWRSFKATEGGKEHR